MTLEEKLAALWPEAYTGKHSLRDFTIDIKKHHDHVRVRVSQMYEYVDCSFKVLMGLSKIFGTESIDIDDYSTSGCETCDYGSSYEKTFKIYDAKYHKDGK